MARIFFIGKIPLSEYFRSVLSDYILFFEDITHKVHHIRYINHIKKSPEFQLPLYFLSMLLKIKIIFVQYDIFFIEILPIAQITLT